MIYVLLKYSVLLCKLIKQCSVSIKTLTCIKKIIYICTYKSLVTDGAAQEANEALLEENKRLRHQAEDLRVGH